MPLAIPGMPIRLDPGGTSLVLLAQHACLPSLQRLPLSFPFCAPLAPCRVYVGWRILEHHASMFTLAISQVTAESVSGSASSSASLPPLPLGKMGTRLLRPVKTIPCIQASCNQCSSVDMTSPTTPDAEARFVLAHVQELSTKTTPDVEYITSTQHIRWHPVPEATAETHGMPSSAAGENLVAMWPSAGRQQQQRQPSLDAPRLPTPLIHVPACRLDVDPVREFEHVKLEQVALPGPAVRTLLSNMALPPGATAISMPHFDDDDDWVYSRCLLADFSGMSHDEASRLSDEGRLCCWASVVLTPSEDGGHSRDICFVVHRVLVHRDPESGRCHCS